MLLCYLSGWGLEDDAADRDNSKDDVDDCKKDDDDDDEDEDDEFE